MTLKLERVCQMLLGCTYHIFVNCPKIVTYTNIGLFHITSQFVKISSLPVKCSYYRANFSKIQQKFVNQKIFSNEYNAYILFYVWTRDSATYKSVTHFPNNFVLSKQHLYQTLRNIMYYKCHLQFEIEYCAGQTKDTQV